MCVFVCVCATWQRAYPQVRQNQWPQTITTERKRNHHAVVRCGECCICYITRFTLKFYWPLRLSGTWQSVILKLRHLIGLQSAHLHMLLHLIKSCFFLFSPVKKLLNQSAGWYPVVVQHGSFVHHLLDLSHLAWLIMASCFNCSDPWCFHLCFFP